jgi:hypothetical protein
VDNGNTVDHALTRPTNFNFVDDFPFNTAYLFSERKDVKILRGILRQRIKSACLILLFETTQETSQAFKGEGIEAPVANLPLWSSYAHPPGGIQGAFADR